MLNTSINIAPETNTQDHDMLAQTSTVSKHQSMRRVLQVTADFELYNVDSINRAQVEDYVKEKYASTYDALVTNFSPFLLTMEFQSKLQATLGMKFAHQGELFLEQYVDVSIEQYISEKNKTVVKRREIVEIGNLAVTGKGSSQLLFLIMAKLLNDSGVKYLVFTATPEVQKLTRKMGLEMFDIRQIVPSMLSDKLLTQWGSYYDTSPHVMVGNLSQSLYSTSQRPFMKMALNSHKSMLVQLQQQLNSFLGRS